MLRTHPAFGIGLAALGAVLLSPDALFMRLSGMEGLQMVSWRGTSMGLIFLAAWALTSRTRREDLRVLGTGAGITIIAAQVFNALLFPTGIALAPVAVMLMAVATAPVWSALLSRALYGEKTGPATWIAIAAVLIGIAIAVTGKGDLAISPAAALGALCGVGVALMLALNFSVLRFQREVPILLAMGLGALLAGGIGIAATGPAQMSNGNVPAILVTAIVILPASFFALSLASRYTAAANVSLLMLLETVLGPLWVWLGTGETPTPRMLTGGAIVVTALAIYLARPKRRARMG
ncbi:EamA-like transporter family protein [Roseivivax sp. THAF40]|uniref:DMT family transporter n=1 Tax=unclassified Roseivivax TaxID=2639302 RepID=UPI00126936A0|nr:MULTISPECIES: DMT family transporter [unclassified Roseivivax]QFS82472.1 EamA-like transporter family protein [Roseivivax sp. THAF197b]QFT46241.1 EamA-like transporter family protein [Roseivivax sp. THAF40]